jgi:hypothetical protein
MMTPTPVGPDRDREHGSALIVTISMLVLLTVATLAFFTRATANRTIENSRTNKLLADQLVATGADHVAGLILGEIATGSTATTNNGIVIYRPTTANSAVPQRVLAAGVGGTDTNFANLVRQTTNGAHNTAAPAQNGRVVGSARWNAPFLLGVGGFANTNQLPTWIYVNRDGTTTNQPSTNAIGRFAANVYDVGGLLDANVVGYPSSVATGSTNQAILKGSVAGADLGLIPGVTDADAFVRWRNANTASSAINYVTGVTNAAATGFLRPASGDHRLQSRQDLITAARNGTGGLTTTALPYLTTFSRAVNAPTWAPTTPAGSSINYAAQADALASTNRFLPNVRVTGSFARADGTTARPGEPLVKHRFPLSRLAGVGSSGVNPSGTTMNGGALVAATAATVQRDFGLVWDSGSRRWTYAGHSGNTAQGGIKTLAQVAAENREPNFFELLKAAVLRGSLGKAVADNGLACSIPDSNVDLQILKMGANLIDQADADDAPTSIAPLLGRSANELVLGIENHPYIYMISQTHFRRRDAGFDYNPANTNNPQPWMTAYAQMQVWNPHLNATTNGLTYRIRALQGETLVRAEQLRPPPTQMIEGLPVDQTGRVIEFVGSQTNFSRPVLLTTTNVTGSTSTENRPPGTSIVGFHLGNVRVDNNLDNDSNPTNDHRAAFTTVNVGVSYQLEFSNATVWTPVQRLYPVRASMGFVMTDNPMWSNAERVYGPTQDNAMGLLWPRTDPRCQRFGCYGTGASDRLNNTTMRPSALGAGAQQHSWGNGPAGNDFRNNQGWSVDYDFSTSAAIPAKWVFNHGQRDVGFTPDDFSDNRTNSPSRVRDPDGVLRPADGNRRVNIPGTNSLARPIILNRPFRSVGEMGYALRDDPWKTLDFASADSADAALLDIFSVTEGPIGGLTAGSLDLNTRQQPVLRAVLAGALKNETDSTTTLTTTEVQNIASAVTNATRGTPLLNRAELVTRIVTAGTNSFSPDDAEIKTRRESIVRALADAGQTRTWNLMFDVVAQTGRFPGAATGAGDFVVEGETRQWVHLAIDRYSGQVVARNTESVNE